MPDHDIELQGRLIAALSDLSDAKEAFDGQPPGTPIADMKPFYDAAAQAYFRVRAARRALGLPEDLSEDWFTSQGRDIVGDWRPPVSDAPAEPSGLSRLFAHSDPNAPIQADPPDTTPAPGDPTDPHLIESPYDDGHAFGWKSGQSASTPDASGVTPIDDQPMTPVQTPPLPTHEVAHRRSTKAIAPVAATVVVVVVAIVTTVVALQSGGPSHPASTNPGRQLQTPGAPAATPSTAVTLPNVCVALPAGSVSAIVGARLSAAPNSPGLGCVYTNHATPSIDLQTAYPPYVSQVIVIYNAPQPGLTASAVAALYSSARSAAGGAQSVTVAGGTGFSAPQDGGVTVLVGGVMIAVQMSATMRPESLGEVRAWSTRIALALRHGLPR